MAVEFEPFDISEHLDSEEMIAGYLSAAAEDEDPNVLIGALLHAAKARGMMQVAKATGLNRESLYKALKPGAHPRFETVQAVLRALGVKLAMSPAYGARGEATNDAGDAARRVKEAVEKAEKGLFDLTAQQVAQVEEIAARTPTITMEAFRSKPETERGHGQTEKAAKTAAPAKSAGKARTATRPKERASSGEARALHRR